MSRRYWLSTLEHYSGYCFVRAGNTGPFDRLDSHPPAARGDYAFFLPVRVLSSLIKRLFLEALQLAFNAGKLQFFHSLEPLRETLAFARQLARAKASDWMVYAKRPFAGPQQVLDYVGRYTHRVAISNNRLLDIEGDQVNLNGRLPEWRPDQNDDPVWRRIHPTFSDACEAKRLSSNPVLRLSG